MLRSVAPLTHRVSVSQRPTQRLQLSLVLCQLRSNLALDVRQRVADVVHEDGVELAGEERCTTVVGLA